VATEDAQRFAKAEGLSYIKTSALEATNVEAAFQLILGDIYQAISKKPVAAADESGAGAGGGVKEGKTINVSDTTAAETKQCCSA
jgi:Ras-related protein Rab-11A